jgi:tetratricopeptide (TPR) repeat protein
VKIVKCFFSALAWLFFPLFLLRADQATDLYNQGMAALNSGDYSTTAQDFDQIIANFPTTPNIHTVRLWDGYAYVRLGDATKAVDILAKETAAGAPSQGTALYYTALAQLEMGSKATDEGARNTAFGEVAATLTRLIDAITTAPTDENRSFLEDALYYRALAYFNLEKLTQAETDVERLLQPPFNNSLNRPDYLLLLGNLYAREASEALNDKKPTEAVRALADKAVQAFDAAIADPNALIQANEARLARAKVFALTAAFDLPALDGYEKALDAYHEVRRKADLIPLQEQRLKELVAKNQAQLQNAPGGATVATENGRLIDRETGRLTDLKEGPDPIIEALIGIAQSYNAMKQGDEARTVLHRLAQATLPPDQQQDVDFALLYSYVLGGETAKADKALDDYLAKHPNDPQAAGLSVQMAGDLMERKDYAGALAEASRSMKDFPQGPYLENAIQLKAQALTSLGRTDEASAVAQQYLKQNQADPGLLLVRAQSESTQGDLNAALADYAKVKNDTAAPTFQAGGTAGYIQTLESLQRYDDVIRESEAFEAKYPDSPLLPNILVLRAVAMDGKHDPGALAALQDVVRKYPTNDESSPVALYYIVTIYQRAGNVPAMIQAAADLAKNFPTHYALLLQAADAVSAAEVKEKKFDLAIAPYQPLARAPDPAVAAAAQNKLGELWLKSAKSLGAYQSMQEEAQRTEAEKRLASAEQSFLEVLQKEPTRLDAVDDAFQGLDDVLVQRRSSGLLKDADFENYLTQLTSSLTDPALQARVELAKAGLVFIEKDGAKQYPTALARFRAAVTANPSLVLTRTEANRYGELLLAAKDYATAQQVYTALLALDPKDVFAQADADYGLGATALAQGNLAEAKTNFEKMKALPGGATWNAHSLDADYGLAYAAEQSGQPADLATAKQTYGKLMQSQEASVELQAKAMLGYARLLAKEGHGTKPATAGTQETAVAYDQQVDTIFGPAVPELSAEGLYQAGQLYQKAADKVDAEKMYQSLLKNYSGTAPDWAAKAQAAGI